MSKMTRKGLNATRCEQLSRDYGITYDSIIHEAIAILLWAIAEKEDGRRICSVEAETIIDNCLVTEFADGSNGYMYESPLLSQASGEIYRRPFEEC